MPSYFITLERQDVDYGMALPCSEQDLARIALQLSGGGLTEESTMEAMQLNQKMRSGSWALVSRHGRQSIVRVEAAS